MFLMPAWLFAQKPCEYSQQVQDSLGVYKSTRNVLMYERNFGSSSTWLYFSLAMTNDLPTLNMQLINKSKEFIKVNCLNKSSRIYLQLANNKIITLIHVDWESCSNSVMSEDGYNNRVLSGYFLFPAGSVDELKKSPVSLLRIKYLTETVDYIIKPELVSEHDGSKSIPETYFQDFLHCMIN